MTISQFVPLLAIGGIVCCGSRLNPEVSSKVVFYGAPLYVFTMFGSMGGGGATLKFKNREALTGPKIPAEWLCEHFAEVGFNSPIVIGGGIGFCLYFVVLYMFRFYIRSK